MFHIHMLMLEKWWFCKPVIWALAWDVCSSKLCDIICGNLAGAPTASTHAYAAYLAFWDAELREYRLHAHIRILQRSNLDRRNWARYLRQQKTKDWSFTNFKLFLACFKNFRTRKNIRSSRQPSQKATSCISRLHKRLSPFHKLSGFKYDISLVVERIHDLSDVAK